MKSSSEEIRARDGERPELTPTRTVVIDDYICDVFIDEKSANMHINISEYASVSYEDTLASGEPSSIRILTLDKVNATRGHDACAKAYEDAELFPDIPPPNVLYVGRSTGAIYRFELAGRT